MGGVAVADRNHYFAIATFNAHRLEFGATWVGVEHGAVWQ
jgi:hypothetical protein